MVREADFNATVSVGANCSASLSGMLSVGDNDDSRATVPDVSQQPALTSSTALPGHTVPCSYPSAKVMSSKTGSTPANPNDKLTLAKVMIPKTGAALANSNDKLKPAEVMISKTSSTQQTLSPMPHPLNPNAPTKVMLSETGSAPVADACKGVNTIDMESGKRGSAGFPSEPPQSLVQQVLKDNPAEEFARTLGGVPTASQLCALFELLPGEVPARSAGDAREKSWTSGAYVKGGCVGLRKNAREFPASTSALTRFMKAKVPLAKFSAVAVFSNIQTPLHRDANNLTGSLNYIVSLTKFKGGGVWLEDDARKRVIDDEGVMRRGRVLDVLKQPLEFDASKRHRTGSWKGSRIVLVAFTLDRLCKLCTEETDFLLKLGFPLVDCDNTHASGHCSAIVQDTLCAAAVLHQLSHRSVSERPQKEVVAAHRGQRQTARLQVSMILESTTLKLNSLGKQRTSAILGISLDCCPNTLRLQCLPWPLRLPTTL